MMQIIIIIIAAAAANDILQNTSGLEITSHHLMQSA
jgi:hypothetical protein